MLIESNSTRNYPLTTRILIACGVVGPILFILMFMIESVIRPDDNALIGLLKKIEGITRG